MKIREFCMFHNEHPALAIKRAESARWVDELHLCESDRTFRAAPRDAVLGAGDSFLRPHLFPGSRRFHPAEQWGFSRHAPFFRRKPMARKNEAMQRNHVHAAFNQVDDRDIVILGDVDEIIDARHADEVIDTARKHGIVSLRLHHTLFYLNLYSTNWHEVWPGSPPDYAYRVFVMTGRHFRTMRRTSDRLRKLGEWGRLSGQIHLMDGFRGFHHSWLGDAQAALDKLESYAHALSDHRPELAGAQGGIDTARLRQFIEAGESIFPGNRLEIRGPEMIEPLASVAENPAQYASLML